MNEQASLMRLLGDDDPSIWNAVREKIISLGCDTLVWLKPCRLSPDAVLRRHACSIIRHFERDAADSRFMAYCLQDGSKIDLERAAFMMAQTQYPEINTIAYAALLDDLASELREWVASRDQGAGFFASINKFFFEEKGFIGNLENYYDPENCFLSKVIDRRTGNPTSMCVVYFLLLRRLGYSVNLIGLPGHSVCSFGFPGEELYIDVFNLGKVLSRQDCIEHLIRCKHEVRDEYLAPMSMRRALARMCGNLEQIYIQLHQEANASRLTRHVYALTR